MMTQSGKFRASHDYSLTEDSSFPKWVAHRREMELYAEGVVFVENATQLKLACEYFLAHPHEREHVARRGQEIFTSQHMAEALRQPVSNLTLPAAPQCSRKSSKANT